MSRKLQYTPMTYATKNATKNVKNAKPTDSKNIAN